MVNWRPMVWILLALLVAACAGAQTEELPTRVIIPTNTPTDTPVPSDTPTQTPTLTPTLTSTATPRATNTPTPTVTPSNTPTRTNTPRPRNTPTRTLTPVPSNTPTPLATPTSDAPLIRLFQANMTTVAPGATVRLRWEADADRARLERLEASGALVESTEVNPIGSTQIVAPQNAVSIIFRLVAIRGTNETRQSLTINVEAPCPQDWFFQNAPSDIGCPVAAPISVPLEYQTFEQGVMFRIQVNGLDRVCGIQRNTNRNLYSCYGYQTFSGTPPETSPPNLQAPGASIQHTFYNTLALGGPWYDVIGWGTSGLNSSNAQAQFDEDGRLYVRLPDGQVYRFDGQLNQTFQPVTTIGSS